MASRLGDMEVLYVRRLGGWNEPRSKADAEGAVNSLILSPKAFRIPLEARLLLAWKDPRSECGLCLFQRCLLWGRPGGRARGPATVPKRQHLGWGVRGLCPGLSCPTDLEPILGQVTFLASDHGGDSSCLANCT